MIELPVRDLSAQFEQFHGHPVRIEIFEGPLDLLLHLVRREEVEVVEVDVVRITDQFLRYLRTMRRINIEVATQFIVMAATLLLLKSRALLPREESEVEEELDEEDPAVELARRLAEYRTYKEAAEILAEAQEARKQIYLRPATSDQGVGGGVVPLEDVSVFDMVAAVQEMLERAKEPPPHTVEREEVTVGERIEQLIQELHLRPRRELYFDELVPDGSTRVFIVVTFLAVLEMIRRGELRVSQDQPWGRIRLRHVRTEEPSET
ncbi:MAG: segregation/condensation protein A [Armatimonadota bacterium]|nr:segregation/condensation protein A [Armatimonadota bacterium]